MGLPADLPTNVATLQALLQSAEERVSERDAIIERKEERITRLDKLMADFKRALFGSRSEKADPDRYPLAPEDIETAIATVHAEDEAIDPPKTQPKTRTPTVDPCPDICRALNR